MLMIERKLPLKQMALYGSTAVLIGFTGTYAILNEIAPKDTPDGITANSQTRQEAEDENKRNNTSTKDESNSSTGGSPDAPGTSELIVQDQITSPQQAFGTNNVGQPTTSGGSAPLTTAPANSGTVSVPSGSSSTGGGSVSQPAPATSQPAPTNQESTTNLTDPVIDVVDEVKDVTNTKLLP